MKRLHRQLPALPAGGCLRLRDRVVASMRLGQVQDAYRAEYAIEPVVLATGQADANGMAVAAAILLWSAMSQSQICCRRSSNRSPNDADEAIVDSHEEWPLGRGRSIMKRKFTRLALTVALLLPFALAAAQQPKPTIQVIADLSEAPRRIVHARLVIPAKPGPMTLVYPKWIPGNHSPSGPINALAGLRLSAGGKSISWRRDSVDMFAFHCDVPPDANHIEAELDYLVSGGAYTEKLAVLNWNMVMLYPKGCKMSEVNCAAQIRLQWPSTGL